MEPKHQTTYFNSPWLHSPGSLFMAVLPSLQDAYFLAKPRSGPTSKAQIPYYTPSPTSGTLVLGWSRVSLWTFGKNPIEVGASESYKEDTGSFEDLCIQQMLPAHLLSGVWNIWRLQLAAQQASWPDTPKKSQTGHGVSCISAWVCCRHHCKHSHSVLCKTQEALSPVPREACAGHVQSGLLVLPQARSHGRWDPSLLENRPTARLGWGEQAWCSITWSSALVQAL